MRKLTQSLNKMVISDPVSNSNIELFYRIPKASELVAYRKGAYKIDGKSGVKENPEFKIEMGLSVIEGIGENSFADENGNAISSDRNKPNFCENWKELVKENASDIVMVFVTNIFEGAKVQGDSDFLE